tara:strand:- start:891 stop:1250 length:360 start_codon:yes stop_codon:yes gene_type:complete
MSEIVLIEVLELIPDVTHFDNNNSNILHKMIENTGLNCIKKFLKIASSKGQLEQIINQKNFEGKTPLHLAVELERHDVSDLLFEHGADTDITDPNGNIVRWVAKMNGGGGIKITGTRKL